MNSEVNFLRSEGKGEGKVVWKRQGFSLFKNLTEAFSAIGPGA